jgi:hypothetical protein
MGMNDRMHANPEVYMQEVERCIGRVIEEFQNNPALYLTESDLKCRLYMVLNSHPLFRRMEPTVDGRTKTCYVHTETSYFVDRKLNKRRVDVTVVAPHNYDFTNKEIVGRKGYSFSEPSIGIELKFNKVKTSANMEKEIREVLDDLQLLAQNRYESKFYLLFLDRKVGYTKQKIDEWHRAYANIKIIYSFQPWA